MDPSAAWMTSQLMEQVMKSGTAASAKSLGFKLPAAGKTGTTNDYKDAWFLGYTSALTCGVWVGFDQPTHDYVAGLRRGPRAAGLDEHDDEGRATLSRRNHSNRRCSSLARTVCANSNQLATNECLAAGAGYEIDLPVDKVPTVPCEIHGGLQTQFAQRQDNLPSKGRSATEPHFSIVPKILRAEIIT